VNPPSGPPLCGGREARGGDVRDAGGTTSKRKRERKQEGEFNRSRMHARAALSLFPRACRARTVLVLSTFIRWLNIDAPGKMM